MPPKKKSTTKKKSRGGKPKSKKTNVTVKSKLTLSNKKQKGALNAKKKEPLGTLSNRKGATRLKKVVKNKPNPKPSAHKPLSRNRSQSTGKKKKRAEGEEGDNGGEKDLKKRKGERTKSGTKEKNGEREEDQKGSPTVHRDKALNSEINTFLPPKTIFSKKNFISWGEDLSHHRIEEDGTLVTQTAASFLMSDPALDATLAVTLTEVSRLLTKLFPHLFVNVSRFLLPNSVHGLSSSSSVLLPTSNPSFLEVGTLLEEERQESGTAAAPNTGLHGLYQSLLGTVQASILLGHRMCITVWGPSGSGKGKLFRLLRERFTVGNSVVTAGPSFLSSSSSFSSSRPEKDWSEGNDRNLVFYLDSNLLKNDVQAVQVMAQQLYQFLYFHLFESEEMEGQASSAHRHSQRFSSRKRTPQKVNTVSSLLRKDEEINNGTFDFGRLFQFHRKFAEVRERIKREKEERQHSHHHHHPQRSNNLGKPNTEKSGLLEKEGPPEDDEDDEEEEEGEEETLQRLLSTNTMTSGAFAPLQRILLKLKNEFSICILIFIRDAEKFGLYCDQLLYILSGLLHEANQSGNNNNNNNNHNNNNTNRSGIPSTTSKGKNHSSKPVDGGAMSASGAMCLLLSSNSGDLHLVEKRLSSRLTTEVLYIPVQQYYHQNYFPVVTSSDVTNDPKGEKKTENEALSSFQNKLATPLRNMFWILCNVLKEIVSFYFKVNLLLEKYNNSSKGVEGEESEEEEEESEGDIEERREEIRNLEALLQEKCNRIQSFIPHDLFSSLFNTHGASLWQTLSRTSTSHSTTASTNAFTSLKEEEKEKEKAPLVAISSSSSCCSSVGSEREESAASSAYGEGEENSSEETVDLEAENINRFTHKFSRQEHDQDDSGGSAKTHTDISNRADQRPSLLLHPTLYLETMIFILDILLEDLDHTEEKETDRERHHHHPPHDFLSRLYSMEDSLATTGASGNEVRVVFSRLLSMLKNHHVSSPTQASPPLDTPSTISLLDEEGYALLKSWLSNRVSLELKILKRNNTVPNNNTSPNKIHKDDVFPWRVGAIVEEKRHISIHNQQQGLDSLFHRNNNSKRYQTTRKGSKLNQRRLFLSSPAITFSLGLPEETQRRRSRWPQLLESSSSSPGLQEMYRLVQLVPSYYGLLLTEFETQALLVSNPVERVTGEGGGGRGQSLSSLSPLSLLPPMVYDLLDEHKLVYLQYVSREGVLLLFYLLLYTEQHKNPTALHWVSPSSDTSAKATNTVVSRSFQDLLEDVASSLGTIAAKRLDRNLFFLAVVQLRRWRLVDLFQAGNHRSNHSFASSSSDHTFGFSGSAYSQSGNLQVALRGSSSRLRGFIHTLFLEHKTLCQNFLGIDAREVQRMSSML